MRVLELIAEKLDILQRLSKELQKPYQPTPQIVPLFYLSTNAPKEIFDSVYRALSKQWHPDTGNNLSQEKMTQLNIIKDQIYSAKAWK